MIALSHWDDANTYYTQTNNPTEQILKKEDGLEWLETCGPTAAVNCLAAAGHSVRIECPGRYWPQPEEVLMDWFNDPINYDAMKRIRDSVDPSTIMGNEVPQWYEAAIPDVFGIPAHFRWGCAFESLRGAIQGNIGVMLCLKKPGHFIAAVAVDGERLIYREPWPGNPWPERLKGEPGFNRSLKGDELRNLQPYRIEVG